MTMVNCAAIWHRRKTRDRIVFRRPALHDRRRTRHGIREVYAGNTARRIQRRNLSRMPKTPEEARKQVDELAAQKVDAIKGILEAGVPGYTFNRMDVNILRAVVDEAHAQKLPVAIHTGNSTDVADAVSLGADSVEHGSFIDEIPDATIAEMKSKGIAYDPTLSVAEAFTQFARGDTTLLKRSLVQQATPKDLLAGTEQAATSDQIATECAKA